MNWRLVAIALALAGASALGGYLKGHHDADQADTVKRLTEQNESLNRTLTSYRDTNQKLTEIANNANHQAETNRAAADALRSKSDGLRKQLADLARLYSPGSATGGAAAEALVGMLAGLLDESIAAGDDLAVEAERYRNAGETCERSYDAVKRSQSLHVRTK